MKTLATEERVEHTPTPWRRDPMFPNAIWAGDVWIASTNTDAKREQNAPNAAFIVTAVNSHEALVSALRLTVVLAEAYIEICAIDGHPTIAAEATVTQARAALQAAGA